MKRLVNYKYADLVAQLLALVVPLIWAVAGKDVSNGFFCYTTVGIIQIISCLFNKSFLPQTLKHKSRGKYETLLSVVVMMGMVLGFVVGIVIFSGTMVSGFYAVIIIGYMLLLLTPIMDLWYLWVTCIEIKYITLQNDQENTSKYTLP
ncbi:hypothetical protein CJD36_007085 [Flavipsychrobacter stenotrophus]|uniref:Uncharacterized protein n=1 Tax=Flavipsychrobacter stenotrophus TaxID=2077091 RepID=A0A2S7SY60_9BACT|nr:hypothetical protein [Flavipsychrobacter stenotrophus]PQJ11557.1 hypothetical protein CJD36_007085 [Flavipsychrobacter stenotrophus]